VHILFILFQKYSIKLGAGVHACNPSYSVGRDQEDLGLKPAQVNSSRDPISNKTKQNKNHYKKRAGGVTQAVEHLSSKHEALSSNSSAAYIQPLS
jgi:hypothetical protein